MGDHYPDAILLSRIAERAMREQGFEPRVPEAALRAANELPDAARAGEGIRDMRELPWSSIDNPESRDLDQIEAVESAGDETILYVAIADVDACAPRRSP